MIEQKGDAVIEIISLVDQVLGLRREKARLEQENADLRARLEQENRKSAEAIVSLMREREELAEAIEKMGEDMGRVEQERDQLQRDLDIERGAEQYLAGERDKLQEERDALRHLLDTETLVAKTWKDNWKAAEAGRDQLQTALALAIKQRDEHWQERDRLRTAILDLDLEKYDRTLGDPQRERWNAKLDMLREAMDTEREGSESK